ncbi:hypothetical protein IFM89_035121 [Coptis chinensis]|uniref:Uncharacterized protein n=1 Tax=Coptis chinensis TaxID=261450 RepID=A0A835IWL4_9MAGN|nr:hypothetical protein IFM89_035121 [Coptis chinensis]
MVGIPSVMLCQLVEVKDGGPAWIHMMDRSTPAMAVWPTKLGGEILREGLDVRDAYREVHMDEKLFY